MGRLPPLTSLFSSRCFLRLDGSLVPAGLSVLVLACDKGGAALPTSRSEQVIATGATPTAPPSAPPPAHAESPRRSGKLCEGDGNVKGRTWSKIPFAHVEAPGRPPLDSALPIGGGVWTWVNFWAAWCGPCKEEMPRLLSWQGTFSKAATPVRLVFVSLDDDRRQLEQFLASQPEAGVKTSLWLPDGPSRQSWLAALRMKSSPELPEQAIVDPNGRLRCFIEGAVDDGDREEIAALMGGRSEK